MRYYSIRKLYEYGLIAAGDACELPDGGTISNIGGTYRFIDKDGDAYRDEQNIDTAMKLVERMFKHGYD